MADFGFTDGKMMEASVEKTLPELTSELRQLKKRHIDAAIEWYQAHARLPRLMSRISGYSIILLSISMPFLTRVDFSEKDMALSVVALLVAGLSGIRSFGRWDSTWRGYKRAQFSLESLCSVWELRMIEVGQLANTDERAKAAIEATRTLLSQARSIVTAETGRFFENLKLPSVPRG